MLAHFLSVPSCFLRTQEPDPLLLIQDNMRVFLHLGPWALLEAIPADQVRTML
jgi:hypothetical protein